MRTEMNRDGGRRVPLWRGALPSVACNGLPHGSRVGHSGSARRWLTVRRAHRAVSEPLSPRSCGTGCQTERSFAGNASRWRNRRTCGQRRPTLRCRWLRPEVIRWPRRATGLQNMGVRKSCRELSGDGARTVCTRQVVFFVFFFLLFFFFLRRGGGVGEKRAGIIGSSEGVGAGVGRLWAARRVELIGAAIGGGSAAIWDRSTRGSNRQSVAGFRAMRGADREVPPLFVLGGLRTHYPPVWSHMKLAMDPRKAPTRSRR